MASHWSIIRTRLKTCIVGIFGLVLHNIIVLGVNLADNIMIGAYSEISLAGVAAVNQIQFVFQQTIMGCGTAYEMPGLY